MSNSEIKRINAIQDNPTKALELLAYHAKDFAFGTNSNNPNKSESQDRLFRSFAKEFDATDLNDSSAVENLLTSRNAEKVVRTMSQGDGQAISNIINDLASTPAQNNAARPNSVQNNNNFPKDEPWQNQVAHIFGRNEKEKGQMSSVLSGASGAAGSLLSGAFNFGKEGSLGWSAILGSAVALFAMLFKGAGAGGGAFAGIKVAIGVALFTSLISAMSDDKGQGQGFGNDNHLASNTHDHTSALPSNLAGSPNSEIAEQSRT